MVHSEPFPTSKMGRFVGIVKALVQNISTIFTKNSMLEVLLSSEYASVLEPMWMDASLLFQEASFFS